MPDDIALTDQYLCCKLEISEHMSNMSRELVHVFLSDQNVLREKQSELQTLLGINCTINISSLNTFGAEILMQTLNACEKEIKNFMHTDGLEVSRHMANTYMKLVYYAKSMGEQLDNEFIRYILRAMKLDSLQGRQLFPCLLSKDIGGVHKDLFIQEVSIHLGTFFIKKNTQLINKKTYTVLLLVYSYK